MANLNVRVMNCLPWMAESMLSGVPDLTFSEKEYRPNEKYPTMWHMTQGQGSGGWAKRRVVSMEEFCLRFRDRQWVIPCNSFKVTRQGKDIEVGGSLTVDVFEGLGSDKGKQWLANVRDGEGGRKFKKGRGAGMGARPLFTAYLVVPALAEGGDQRFARFKDNAVHFTYRTQPLFANLGVRYRDNRPTPQNAAKPFALLTFRLDHLGDMTIRETDETYPCTPILFSNMFGRRPDFLFDREGGNDILTAAATAGAGQVPADMREWFNNHFPVDTHSRVPITFAIGIKDQQPDEYTVYDLKAEGTEFDKVFHAGQNECLAVWSVRQKRWVEQMGVSTFSRGIEVNRFPVENLGIAAPEIRSGYKDLQRNALRWRKIADLTQDIPIFVVNVAPLSTRDASGTWVPVTSDEYDENRDDRPSRGVHVEIFGQNLRLGIVDEVPSRSNKKKVKPRKKGHSDKAGNTKPSVQAYIERDPRIAVTYMEKDRLLALNPLYPALTRFDVPDEIDSPSQKLLMRVYHTLRCIAVGVADALREPVRIETSPAIGTEVDDEGVPIYNGDRYDWPVNKVIAKYLADSLEVQELFSKVDDIRHNAPISAEAVAPIEIRQAV